MANGLGIAHSPSPMSMAANNIKCSTCGVWVDLVMLGEHICDTAPLRFRAAESDSSESRRRRPEMRLDLEPKSGSSPRLGNAHNGNLNARSPGLDPARLGPMSPLTPSSHPNSPSYFTGENELSRSISSTSSIASTASTSKNKLPFFEKYQQMVGSKTQGAPPPSSLSALPRSGANPNLSSLSGNSLTPPLSPSPSWAPQSNYRAPSPSPSAGSQPRYAPPPPVSSSSRKYSPPPRSNGGVPHDRALPSRSRGDEAGSALPYESSSSVGSRASSADIGPTPETPTSSIVYGSPPRSRKISLPSSAVHPRDSGREDLSSYNSASMPRYDHRQTIVASQSTPNNLGYSSGPTRDRPRSRRRTSQETKGSSSGLDACLEDLLLMTSEDNVPAFESLSTKAPLGSDYYEEDTLATPRPSRRAPIPQSQSTPALSAYPIQALSRPSDLGAPRPRFTPLTPNCTTCNKVVPSFEIQKSGDGQPFCRPCYADRFLPKCRKCKLPIEGGAVTSSDGKVLGKYHSNCFSCFECSAPFPDKEFYVFDSKPYCQLHYHNLNGSLCTSQSCGKPIEGPCVSLVGEENGGGGRYHPECFRCSNGRCQVPLLEHHFVVGRLPYCERHAEAYAAPPPANPTARAPTANAASATRAQKRMTIITRR